MRKFTSSDHSNNLLLITLGTAIAHVVVLLLFRRSQLGSNLLQLSSAALAASACVLRGRESEQRRLDRVLWWKLAFAFFIWTIGEGLFTLGIVLHLQASASPGISDVAWLTFPFAFLLVAARQDAKGDTVTWMDIAQSTIFFGLLCALVFVHPAAISMATAYDVQSLAMILMCALRYSATAAGTERVFSRNLLVFALAYGIFSALGYAAPGMGFKPGSLVDLCWSSPFLVFSVLTLLPKAHRSKLRLHPSERTVLHHLQGVSALGLAVMSIVASVILTHSHPVMGWVLVGVTLLIFTIRTAVREWQLCIAHEDLKLTALHDALTNLPNRINLHQVIANRLSSRDWPITSRIGILLIDLDRFKMLNEGWGRSVGDRVLKEVADRIRSVLRSQDVVARYGGDAFMVLFGQVDESEATAIACRLVTIIRQPFPIDGKVLYVTASAGFVLADCESDAESMMRDADCALDNAKLSGKDRMEVFVSSMRQAADRKARIEIALRDALANNSLQVYYQPICSLPGRDIVGFETLVRWTHPELGIVSPAEFIPVAENVGFIIQLGDFVLRQACLQVASWNKHFNRALFVSVNLSARQFDDPILSQTVAAALSDSHLPPSLLKLEITESVLLSGQQNVAYVLGEMRALGIQVCLDDFGTGYSSLSYLLRYEFDVIKVDQSFVRHLDQDHVRAELVKTVIQLAKNLGKQVVAEGVELPEELEYLGRLNCHMVQGYLLARPLSAAVAETVLEQERQWQPLNISRSDFDCRPILTITT